MTTNPLKLKIRMAGLTYIELAERLGVRYSTMGSWLNGLNRMPVGMIERIETVCDMSRRAYSITNCARPVNGVLPVGGKQ